MAKPTIVLVHGAWHTPTHWEPLIKSLKSYGYRTRTPALPSTLDPNVPGTEIPTDQEPDIAVVRQAVMEELDLGFNVVVVPHSYGGMPAVSALTGLGPGARSEAGYKNSVVAIAAISTFVLPEGMPLHQNQSRDGGMHVIIDNLMYAKESPGPVAAFYHDVPKAEAEKWASLLKPASSIPAMMQPSKYTAYPDIPVHYLLCTDDRANPEEVQRLVVDRIKQNEKSELHVTELSCSHSPFLSRVDETTAFVRKAAGEKVAE